MKLKKQIIASLESLSEAQRNRILKYLNSFKPKMKFRGIDMLKFVGSISKSGLLIMQSIINVDCEVIEKNN